MDIKENGGAQCCKVRENDEPARKDNEH